MSSIATRPSAWQPSVASIVLSMKCTLLWLPKSQTNRTPGTTQCYTTKAHYLHVNVTISCTYLTKYL